MNPDYTRERRTDVEGNREEENPLIFLVDSRCGEKHWRHLKRKYS